MSSQSPSTHQDLPPDIADNKRRARSTILISMSAIILIVLLCGYIVWADYRTHLDGAEKNTLFISNLVASQARSSLNGLELMLQNMHRELLFSDMKIDDELNPEIHQYLINLRSIYQDLMDVLILDQRGKIIQWTGQGFPPPVTDRHYTREHLDNPDSSLFIGEPLLSKVHTDQWFFAVSRAQRNADQSLKYIYVAIIDIQHYITQFQNIGLLEGNSMGLISRSGKLITRLPDHNRYVGQVVPGLDFVWEKAEIEGNFNDTSPLDGVERIIGYRLLPEFNIAAFSTASRTTELTNWYSEIKVAFVILISVILITLYLTRRILRYQSTVLDQRQRLFTLATTDPLTGIYNRRYCLEMLQNEINRSKRHHNPLSFLMIDIDYFKKVNDTYGHIAGDQALKKMASILRLTCREGDIISRYGGEEFLIVLPETSILDALNLAERLRRTTEKETVDIGETNIQLTISIGVSTFEDFEHEYPIELVINDADKALYKAKHAGRNRVFSSQVDHQLTLSV